MPEFLNRVDETIIFQPLAEQQIRRIATIQIDHLMKQMAQAGLALEVSEGALDEIARRGYDPTFGARPLKRVIQQQVQNPLATEILKGQFPEGSVVKLDFQNDQFVIERQDQPAATM